MGDPPKTFSKPEIVLWKSVTDILSESDMLFQIDRLSLIRYVQFVALWMDCKAEVAEKGRVETITDKEDNVRSYSTASYKQMMELDKSLKQFEKEFGMGNQSRSRMMIPLTRDHEEDELLTKYDD